MISSLEAFADYVFDLIETNKTTLGVASVFYGDQDRIPYSPAVCIDTEQKVNILSDAQRRVQTEFTISVYVYYAAVNSPQDNRRDADKLAEAIETLLHSDPTCDNKVIHSYVTVIESGYSQKTDSVMRSSRLTFTGMVKRNLPAAQWN